jgi:phage terminase large subunit-like protein
VLHHHHGVRVEAQGERGAASAARTSRCRAATARASCSRASGCSGSRGRRGRRRRVLGRHHDRAGEHHPRRRRRDAGGPALLAAKLGLKRTAHAIFQPSTNSTFKALSREAKNQEGKNIHFGLVDELHAHPTRETWDVVIMGAAKRTQSLVWAITTAGVDMAGICYEVRGGVVKMLDGSANDQLFGIIYTIDEGDDWRLESSWIKANPNWHASIDIDLFRMDATEAMQTASKENNFKTKHLERLVQRRRRVDADERVGRVRGARAEARRLREEPCVIGLDLATKTDIAAKREALPPRLADRRRREDQRAEVREALLPVHAVLPPRGRDRGEQEFSVRRLGERGPDHVDAGNVLDFEAVKTTLRADRGAPRARGRVRPVAVAAARQRDDRRGLNDGRGPPTVQNFSAPMKELEALVLSGRLHHDGNPVMRWMISNVVCHRDAKDNIYPRKEKPENKIDGPVAAMMALNRAMLAPIQVSTPTPTAASCSSEVGPRTGLNIPS